MTIQEKLNQIQCNLKAPKGQTNDFGHYKYRSCEDILEAVKPHLKEQKVILTLTDEMCNIADRFYVRAVAILRDCESKDEITTIAYAREAESKKGMDESQITGASSSYARKYALNGLFLIDDTKDADTQDNTKEDKPKPKTNSEEFSEGLKKDLLLDITTRCKELKPDITKEELSSFIEEKTGEKFIKANFNKIIEKLDILLSERL